MFIHLFLSANFSDLVDVKKGEMKVKFKKGNEPIDWEGICDTDKEIGDWKFSW